MTAFSLPIVPRYAEVDQQGVVFNGHYLTWFDEACTSFLDHLDVTYPGLIASGHDIQVVHSEIDFMGPVRWRDSVCVEVSLPENRIDQFHARVQRAARRARQPRRTARRSRCAATMCTWWSLRRLGQATATSGIARSARFG